MYAVVEAGGLQYRVAEGDIVRLPMLVAEPGAKYDLDRILLIAGENEQRVGKPVVEGARVEAMVLTQGKSEKVLIFKKRKRTKYRRFRGHRQDYTDLKIEKIVVA
jgi:large subunit ribosomal protein L21